MLDVLTALVWDEPVDHYAATGMPVRTGNADPRGAPINVYPCRRRLGRRDLHHDGAVEAARCAARAARMGAMSCRRSASARSTAPRSTTRSRRGRGPLPAREVERRCSSIGVPAAVVREPVAARDDEQLAHRGLLEPLRHPDASEPSGFLGARCRSRSPVARSSCRRPSTSEPAPTTFSVPGSASTPPNLFDCAPPASLPAPTRHPADPWCATCCICGTRGTPGTPGAGFTAIRRRGGP